MNDNKTGKKREREEGREGEREGGRGLRTDSWAGHPASWDQCTWLPKSNCVFSTVCYTCLGAIKAQALWLDSPQFVSPL